MKKILIIAITVLMAAGAMSAKKQKAVQNSGTEQWLRYEVILDGPKEGSIIAEGTTYKNPFVEVMLTADFTSATTGKTVRVRGFYDGEGKYKVRFMPTEVGNGLIPRTATVLLMTVRRAP